MREPIPGSRLTRVRLSAALCGAALALTQCAVPPIPSGSVPISDHFDGVRFFNPDGRQGSAGEQARTLLELIRQDLHPENRTWPKQVEVSKSVPARRVDGNEMLVTWIGHSTVLVQTQGINILIDPVWAERASPVSFAGVKRSREPGVALRDLPRIDLILISHDHYDHLDTHTLSRLWRRDRPLIVAGLEVDRLLKRYGIKANGLDWGQSIRLNAHIRIFAERAHHWSAHGIGDHNRSLWCGFTVTLPGGNIYYAGDTGPGDMKWASEARRRGPVRLAVLPIGAYNFEGRPTDNHIGPDQAVTAYEQLEAAYALGVHWGTFELTSEGIDQPAQRLNVALARERIPAGRFRAVRVGEVWPIPSSDPPS